MSNTTGSNRPLAYEPCPAGIDTGRYDVAQPLEFPDDPVCDATFEDIPLARDLAPLGGPGAPRVTLPDQIPCIYQTADSPRKRGEKNPRPRARVVSPDIEMLTALLPDYQELWHSHTSQWAETPRRIFAVGRLNDLTPSSVYRPGTTPEQVIGSTMLTHEDTYRRAPERLRRIHPRYADWNPTPASAVR